MSFFENATRKKYRYPSDRGLLNTEQLWDLSATALNTVWKNIKAQMKDAGEESLLSTKSDADAELAEKAEIVKAIFDYKVAAREAAKKASENKAQKEKLMAVLERKQDAALEQMSVEELKKMIENL